MSVRRSWSVDHSERSRVTFDHILYRVSITYRDAMHSGHQGEGRDE